MSNSRNAARGVQRRCFGILSVIGANPGVNQGSIGRVLGIQRANMVALINELVDAGLVDRQVAVNDRRAFALELTKDGKATMKHCLSLIAVHEAEMLSDLSVAERGTLIDLLDRIEAHER